ncbi:hypothetical protein [Ornithinimicrobium panacihumi]|uniref:hypothetical protein n=1 Tax=Ornithinimicrobium panacihumi TaxID=2008449 RepID=UPI003F8A6338
MTSDSPISERPTDDPTGHPVFGDLGLTPAAPDPVEKAGQEGEVRHRIPEPEVVDLTELGAELLERARAGGTGRAVRAVVRQPGQSLILLALPAGGGLPDHDAPGPASLLCLSGEVVLAAGGREWPLTAGRAVLIPQERHEVRAAVDSLCVLTVSLPR